MFNFIKNISVSFFTTIVFSFVCVMQSLFAFSTGKKHKRYIRISKTPAVINLYDEGFMDTPAFLRLQDK